MAYCNEIVDIFFKDEFLLVGVLAFCLAIILLYYIIYWKAITTKFPLWYTTSFFTSALLWVVCGYSLTHNGLQDGIIGNLSDAFFLQISGNPHDDLFDLIFSKELFFSLLAIILLQTALINRINKLSSSLLSLAWLLFVSYPILFMTQGPGLVTESGVHDLMGSFSIHIIAGTSALAIVLYAKPAQLIKSNLKWDYKPIALTIGVAFFYQFFQWHSGQQGLKEFSIFMQTFALSLVIQVVIKVINRIKIRVWDPAACLMASIAYVSGFGVDSSLLFIVISSISIGLLCYFFLDYLNYNEIDPAYLIFVIHGIFGLVGIVFNSIYFSLLTNNQLVTINPERYIGIGIVLGAYAFLFTYLTLGFLNRFMVVKENQA
jgi:ammonia channel protein AmtB